ncbi:hypothetical protein V2J09_001891 [Rumex salicifolius]
MSSNDPALSLNLGLIPTSTNHSPPSHPPDSDYKLSLTLTLSAAAPPQNQPAVASPRSSLSNGSAVVPDLKRERDPPAPAASGTASEEVDDEELTTNVRKKLRLTKDQSALLEESFKLHSTLNPKQKLALADRLNLRPRQVEVWFQNRRARTKLKQTEVDCELLKKWCETLTNENRRLQKEVQELRALKAAPPQPPYYMQLPAATLTMCPACERTNGTASELRRR